MLNIALLNIEDMKQIIFAALVALFFIGNVSAQDQVKVGYVIVDSVMTSLPEYQTQMKIFESYSSQLDEELTSKRTTLQTKFQEYQEKAPTWLPDIVQEREKEIQQLQTNLQEFAQQVQGKLAAKEQELLGPVLVKIQQGIDDIAKEKGFTFIMNEQIFLYADSTYDITNDVIKKLGGEVSADAATNNE